MLPHFIKSSTNNIQKTCCWSHCCPEGSIFLTQYIREQQNEWQWGRDWILSNYYQHINLTPTRSQMQARAIKAPWHRSEPEDYNMVCKCYYSHPLHDPCTLTHDYGRRPRMASGKINLNLAAGGSLYFQSPQGSNQWLSGILPKNSASLVQLLVVVNCPVNKSIKPFSNQLFRITYDCFF